MDVSSGPERQRGTSGNAMKIVLTTDWTFEQLAPYTKQITAAIHKLQQRFPRDVVPAHLVHEIEIGKRQLWLILTDDDEFVSFVLTEVQVADATGLKTLLIPSLAGEEGASAVHLIGELERWGKEHECDEVMVYGRLGWKRSLESEGYKMDMVTFRKAL